MLVTYNTCHVSRAFFYNSIHMFLTPITIRLLTFNAFLTTLLMLLRVLMLYLLSEKPFLKFLVYAVAWYSCVLTDSFSCQPCNYFL